MTCDPQQCPKCGYESGDTWAQCEGSCPMPMSPHYVADVRGDLDKAMADATLYGTGVVGPDGKHVPVKDMFFDPRDAIIEGLEKQLKTVLDREAETHRRHDERVEALGAEIDRLSKAMRRNERAAEMSAGIMRDKRRTGGWAGAEKTARAFDRIADNLRKAAQ